MNSTKELALRNLIKDYDLEDSLRIPRYYIDIEEILKGYNDSVIYNFKVGYNEQQVTVRNNEIIDVNCDCFRYGYTNSCLHLGAILNNYYDYIISGDMSIIEKEISLGIMNELSMNKDITAIRKKCEIEVDIKLDNGNRYLNLKIGEKKILLEAKS